MEKYSLDWFKNRAFESIRKIEGNLWDFSDSLLLYVPGAEQSYEEIQRTNTPYHALVTKPERAYLERIAEVLVERLPQEFEYVDLGPGSEHKEQFVFDAAKGQGKRFVYTPVDINERFLELAKKYASEQGIEAKSVRSSFEELPEILGAPSLPRFVSLGLTYSNYRPEDILPLLKAIAGERGSAFINAQLRERSDMKKLVEIYAQDGYSVAKSKFTLIGLDAERDVEKTEADDGIRIWSTLKGSTPVLESKGITTGSKLLILQSLRPTKELLEKDVLDAFPDADFFDTNETFVGTLLK